MIKVSLFVLCTSAILVACGGDDAAPCTLMATPFPPECTGDFMASVGASGLHIKGSPKTVGVQLESDGNALVDEQLEPEYDRNYPNGKECGGYCQQAVVTVQLAP